MKKSDKDFELFRKENLLQEGQYSKYPIEQKANDLPKIVQNQLKKVISEAKETKSVVKDEDINLNKKGITVLFAGPSGTGKTMAANLIANQLKEDLFRVDLSSLVNKYIGETEKNLNRIFTIAEKSKVILFFDEADALFGKRSKVKDSHDRFSNSDVSFLLKRIESFKGLVILAANNKENMEEINVRSFKYVIQFPQPIHKAKKRFWKYFFKNLFKRK